LDIGYNKGSKAYFCSDEHIIFSIPLANNSFYFFLCSEFHTGILSSFLFWKVGIVQTKAQIGFSNTSRKCGDLRKG
jgi:hypothetical protein